MQRVVDTTIVECNRRNSIDNALLTQKNPALYTNEIGSGVKLNVGDEVSVAGVYISEIGAGADTIELKGDTLLDYRGRPKTKTIDFTEVKNSAPTMPVFDDKTGEAPVIGGYQLTEVNASQKIVHIKDNEAEITIQYWKSNNGEGYISLPVLYDVAFDETIPSDSWTNPSDDKPYPVLADVRLQCSADYQRWNFPLAPQPRNDGDGLYYLKSDNTRHTLMKRTGITSQRAKINFYFEDKDVITTPRPSLSNDPALDGFIEYKELLPIQIKPGFNSPSNIANQITSQLKEAKDPRIIRITDESSVSQDVAVVYENNTWKPFNCAAHGRFSADGFKKYTEDKPDSSTPQGLLDMQTLLNYYNSFENICVKRPDLWEIGRKVNNSGYPLWEDASFNNTLATDFEHGVNNIVETNIQYSEVNCSKISQFLKVQANYPELVDNDNINTYVLTGAQEYRGNNIDNVRYLHVDTGIIAGGGVVGDFLGCDNNSPNANKTLGSAIAMRGGTAPKAYDMSSKPLFFYYQKDTCYPVIDRDN